MGGNMSSIGRGTIVIVEDTGVVCMAYEAMFSSMGYTVLKTVDNYSGAKQILKEYQPDICTLDLRIRPAPGASASLLTYPQICSLLTASPKTAICVMTEVDSTANIEVVLSAGVKGFFTKTFEPSELATCFEYLVKGKSYYQQCIASTKVSSVAQRRAQHNTEGSPFDSLTSAQKVVCADILAGFDPSEIARRRNLAQATVSRYRQRIRDIVGVANDVQLVYQAQRYGFCED